MKEFISKKQSAINENNVNLMHLGELQALQLLKANKFDVNQVIALLEQGKLDDALTMLKEAGISVTMMEKDGAKVISFTHENIKYTIFYNEPSDEIDETEPTTQEEVETHTEKRTFNDGSYMIDTVDANGKIIKYESYDKNGNLTQWCLFEYNENGVNTKQTVYNADGNWYVNEFNEQGKNTVSYGGRTHNIIEDTTYYSYHENGALKSTTCKDNNGDIICSSEFDETGKIIYKTEGRGEHITKYEYLDDGTRIETKKNKDGEIVVYGITEPNGNQTINYYENGKLAEITTFTYDENGGYSIVTTNANGNIIVSEQYDKNGNLIFKTKNNQNYVTTNVVADTDRLLYRLTHQGDLSVLGDLIDLGATVGRTEDTITVDFEGKTYAIDINTSPEMYETISKIQNITTNFTFGTISLEECCKQLEALGAKITRQDDGTIDYDYAGEMWGIWGTIGENDIIKNCKGADYTILKAFGFTDSQIEEYFYRVESTNTFADGRHEKIYAYSLREGITLNGKHISNITELMLELNKNSEKDILAFNSLCYRLEQGDITAIKELEKMGIQFKTVETQYSTTYDFEYNGQRYSIQANKTNTKEGKLDDISKKLIAQYRTNLISFEELYKQLSKLFPEVEIKEIGGRKCITLDVNDTHINVMQQPREQKVTQARYNDLRAAGLNDNQIKKFFHLSNEQDSDSNYKVYALNENIKLFGKSINTIRELIYVLNNISRIGNNMPGYNVHHHQRHRFVG